MEQLVFVVLPQLVVEFRPPASHHTSTRPTTHNVSACAQAEETAQTDTQVCVCVRAGEREWRGGWRKGRRRSRRGKGCRERIEGQIAEGEGDCRRRGRPPLQKERETTRERE